MRIICLFIFGFSVEFVQVGENTLRIRQQRIFLNNFYVPRHKLYRAMPVDNGFRDKNMKPTNKSSTQIGPSEQGR